MRKVIGALAVVAGGNASNSTPAHELRGRRRFGGGLLAGVMLAGALAGSAPAQAQGFAQMGAQGAAQLPAAASAPAVSREVVQPLPAATDPSRALNSALMQLARDPRDPEALLSAGESALAMGDVQAAIGFLTRAERLTPSNQRVLTALGGARLRSQDPVAALEAFDAAARLGPLSAEQLSDQALSHDLVGDNPPAQRLYREALAKGAGDEAARRLALSLAIVGDRRGVDMVLAPMLQKQDRSAWRIRAFAFAIMGREDEAVAIASTTMPADLANGMAPYLRYMRRLTPAQQAAAANLGFFPQASQIGQEDPRIAAYASLHGIHHTTFAEPELASAVDARARGAKAEPRRATRRVREGEDGEARSGEARSGESRTAEARGATASTAGQGGEIAPPVPAPSRESQPAAPVELVARPVAAPAARPAVSAPRPAAPAAATPSFSSLPAGGSGFDLASVNNGAVARPAAQAAPGAQRAGGAGEVARAEVAAQTAERAVPQRPATPRAARAEPARHATFSEAFSGLGGVASTATPSAGAVDIRKIAAPRPAPKAPPPPAHPSRIWVQVGVGRDTDRIVYDWRRLTREEAELFKGRKPFVTEWGRTNRLLTGPFETEAAAKAYNDKLHKGDHGDSFVWISPAGQVVDPLDGR